jgi:3-oxoadipate enol-lactonase
MARVQTSAGYEIGYDEAGGGEKMPLVLLHGVGSDKSVWRPQLGHFGQERRTVAFDYPGYGDSDPAPEGTSRDDYAAAIVSAMAALGIGKAHICGLSLGGVVAIAIHDCAPDACASLILADSFASHPDGQAIYERSLAASDNMRVFAESRVDVLLAQPADPAVRSEVIETMSWIDPAAYRTGAEAVWLADQVDRADAIRVPTLVVCGDHDRITPPALSTSLTRMIPGAHYEAIENAGHLSNLEQPAAFNTIVGAFIRGVDSHS